MTRAARWQRLSRRDAMRLLGAGTTGFVAACRGNADPAAPLSGGETAIPPTAAASDQPIIRTILRDVARDELGDGAILMHEHLSATSSYPFEPPPRREVPPHFTGDVSLITDEVRIAGTEGVACIVDGGHADMGRSLEALRRIAQGSSVHIVVGGGFYTQRAYPPDIASKTVEQITDDLVAETEAERFGAYGEIGTSGEMTADERNVLTAVARAHVRTGVPIFTHNAYVGNWRAARCRPRRRCGSSTCSRRKGWTSLTWSSVISAVSTSRRPTSRSRSRDAARSSGSTGSTGTQCSRTRNGWRW